MVKNKSGEGEISWLKLQTLAKSYISPDANQ